jgi:uncharacterized membrane protein YsdA (DUF1294 family)
MSVKLFLILYFLTITLITFLVFAIDKKKAVNHEFRIPESVLFILSVIGGSVGALIGMYTLHHKNRKLKFRIGIPAILITEAALIFYFFHAYSIRFLN